jgi:ABC-2 type transport system permease protein
MSRKFVFAIARRILQQFRHDRRTLALLFLAPIIILGLFDVMIRGGSSDPSIDVVNRDAGPVGAVVAQALEHSNQVAATGTDLSTAINDLNSGTVAAYVVLPQDFSSKVRTDFSIAPEVHLEGTQPSLTQPVMLSVSQSLTGAVKSFAATAGTRIPTVDPQVTYLHGGASLDTLDYFAGAFIGLIVFFLVFIVTIVSFLRERSQGTLERLMASSLRRGDIVVGYMLGFGVVAAVQAAEVLLFTLYVLHVHNEGSVIMIALIALLMTITAVNLGVLLSMFAKTEFQAVQFIPLVIVPQVLLSGIIFPVNTEPHWLQVISNVLPLTYGVYGLRDVMLRGYSLNATSVQLDLAVLAGFVILLIVGAALTLRREVA